MELEVIDSYTNSSNARCCGKSWHEELRGNTTIAHNLKEFGVAQKFLFIHQTTVQDGN